MPSRLATLALALAAAARALAQSDPVTVDAQKIEGVSDLEVSARGAADFLTRTTKWLAVIFVALAIVLAALALTFVGDGVFLVDDAGVIRLWNPSAEAITGLPAGTVRLQVPRPGPADPPRGEGVDGRDLGAVE